MGRLDQYCSAALTTLLCFGSLPIPLEPARLRFLVSRRVAAGPSARILLDYRNYAHSPGRPGSECMGAHIRMDKEEMHKLAEPAPVAHAAIHNAALSHAGEQVPRSQLPGYRPCSTPAGSIGLMCLSRGRPGGSRMAVRESDTALCISTLHAAFCP